MSETTAFIGIALVAFAGILLIILISRRNRLKRERLAAALDEPSDLFDSAFNRIEAASHFADRMQREGYRVAGAREYVSQARSDLSRGDPTSALQMARKAQELLLELRRAGPPGSPDPEESPEPSGDAAEESRGEPMVRDLARRVGDPEEALPAHREGRASFPVRAAPEDARSSPPSPQQEQTMPDEETSTMSDFRRSLPKNFLEARFELKMLVDELAAAEAASSGHADFREASLLAQQSQKALDRKDFTEGLRLAVRGRRRLGSQRLETISLSPGTVVEPPPGPTPMAQRSSGPPPVPEAAPDPDGPAKPLAVPCPRCGRENPADNRFCRGCGKPLTQPKCPRCQRVVELEDAFCGSCGAPLAPV